MTRLARHRAVGLYAFVYRSMRQERAAGLLQAMNDNHDKEVKEHGSKDEIEKNGPEEGTFL